MASCVEITRLLFSTFLLYFATKLHNFTKLRMLFAINFPISKVCLIGKWFKWLPFLHTAKGHVLKCNERVKRLRFAHKRKSQST